MENTAQRPLMVKVWIGLLALTLIEVLLAHRSLPATALQEAMRTAVATGMCDPQVVIIEARRNSHGEDRTAGAVPIGVWARYDRPAPTLAGYDVLLTGSEG